MNIFPTGDTVINKIYSEPKLIKEIYGKVKKSNDLIKEKKKQFSIPFLKNLRHLSPIHQCLQSENFQALDVFLQVIKNDDVDNHIRSFIDKFPNLMRFQLPSLDEYISSRVFKTETMSVLKKGKLNIWEDLDCAIHAAPLWPDVHDLKTHLL